MPVGALITRTCGYSVKRLRTYGLRFVCPFVHAGMGFLTGVAGVGQ